MNLLWSNIRNRLYMITIFQSTSHSFNLNPLQQSFKLDFKQHQLITVRHLRTRLKPSTAYSKSFNLNNKNDMTKTWPPMEQMGDPISPSRSRETLFHLEQLEKQKLTNQRNFFMPYIKLGDLIEIRYELSRTKQTFAVFQGYCVEFRNKGLNSSFCLKNTYDGVGVEQRIPLYSPRLLNVRVIKALSNNLKVSPVKPFTRDYRYKWHNFVRHKFERKIGNHKPGIRSVEPRIRRKISKITKRYMRQRIASGLPPYVSEGPYNILSRRRSRLIRAERYRRMQIYSYDEDRLRAEKLRKRRYKHKWGVFKIKTPKSSPVLEALPEDHPLLTAPK